MARQRLLRALEIYQQLNMQPRVREIQELLAQDPRPQGQVLPETPGAPTSEKIR